MEGRREAERESKRERERERVTRERETMIKGGTKRGGHVDEGGSGMEGRGDEERGKKSGEEGMRESIEVYEKTIELICKQ